MQETYHSPDILQLSNGKVVTVFTQLNSYFVFACWDLKQKEGQELLRTIHLPMGYNTRGLELLTEDNQNRLVMITDEITSNPRLITMDLNSYQYTINTIENQKLQYYKHGCSFINNGQQLLLSGDDMLQISAIPHQSALAVEPAVAFSQF